MSENSPKAAKKASEDELRKRVIDPAGRRTSVDHRRPSSTMLSLADLSIDSRSISMIIITSK